MNKKIFLITIVATIILVTIATILMFSQNSVTPNPVTPEPVSVTIPPTDDKKSTSSEQITVEKAKTLAINKIYPRWDEMNKTNKTIYKNIVLDMEIDLLGNYIVHVCDLNVECYCRPDEGYWIKVAKDGSTVSIQRANLCPYG